MLLRLRLKRRRGAFSPPFFYFAVRSFCSRLLKPVSWCFHTSLICGVRPVFCALTDDLIERSSELRSSATSPSVSSIFIGLSLIWRIRLCVLS